jgi:thioredoxin reductase
MTEFDALYAALPFEQSSPFPVELGCALTEQGYIAIDGFQKTTVEGIYACGDNTAMMRSIANAVYGGNLAGAMVNKELTEETF